jgi:DNA-directed RNA polymerase specialized sigma24 family protein
MFAEVEMPDEEAELLRLLQEAFGPGLRRFVMRLTADGMFADDVVQETLIRAWQHPAILQRPEPAVRAWLFTVARHLVIDDHVLAATAGLTQDRPIYAGCARGVSPDSLRTPSHR